MSRKTSRFLLPVILGLVLLSQFNNCDNYSTSNFDSMMSIECVGTSCFTQEADNLELDLNVGGAYSVAAGVRYLQFAGYCNEANFPRNKITWELYLNTALVGSSMMSTLNTSCVNGRFSIFVDLSDARAGLVNPATTSRVQHFLEVEIIGIDSKNLENRSNYNSRKRVVLNPI